MTTYDNSTPRPLLLMVAGAKGAVATTLAVAVAALRHDPAAVTGSLTTAHRFPYLGDLQNIHMVGWDTCNDNLADSAAAHGVLPESLYAPVLDQLGRMALKQAPGVCLSLKAQIAHLMADIRSFRERYAAALPVFINLLPACEEAEISTCRDFNTLNSAMASCRFPDLAYVLAAIRSGIPVVNFTPNTVEIPIVCEEAVSCGVPLAGRDGKTGQTYLKVVLASALKARRLYVDGWYSLNILGNADGKNLMDPGRAAGKVANKTRLLDEILGYAVGESYGESAHKVHIAYYPPRGDAKEAWDVIDFKGLFGLPMSIRLNLQGRDSILAAPMALDLARWVTALHLAGYAGPIPDLGFYFKKPVGNHPPLTFQDQVTALDKLEKACDEKPAVIMKDN